MDLEFGDLKRKVIRILADDIVEPDYGETVGGTVYSADTLKDAICAALDAITVRIWKSQTEDIDGGESEYDAPDDAIGIEGIYDKTVGSFLPMMGLRANKNTLVGVETNAWIDYPEGTIAFVNILGTDGAKIYYSASWTKPVDDDDALEPPESTVTALVLFAASYCLLNKATGSANIRQFDTKVDSGQPTDNPLKDMSDFFLRRFELELQRIPTRQKGITQ